MQTYKPRRRRLFFGILAAVLLLIILCVLLIVIIGPIWPPGPVGPTANAGGPYMVGEAQPLTLDGSGSKGTIVSYVWDLGDGTSGSGVKPTHTYDDGPKQYTVKLTVTDNQGRTASATSQVTVNNLPPTANAGGPYTCQVGQIIQLNGVCSDPSPVDSQTLKCTWADFSGAALSQPSYQCPATPGQVTVTLTATDKDGASAQSTATITVGAGAVLKADADGPYTGTVGSPVTVDGSGSSPADQIISYQWTFGDGQSGDGKVTTHTYTLTGTYTVTLTVSDGTNQASDSTTATITANRAPTAVIKPEAIPKTSGQCYRFTGSDSKDPDGQIVSYVWDLGDNTTRRDPVIEYCYTKAGRYKVTLTVTDNDGLTGSASTVVSVPAD